MLKLDSSGVQPFLPALGRGVLAKEPAGLAPRPEPVTLRRKAIFLVGGQLDSRARRSALSPSVSAARFLFEDLVELFL
jgi:hypothetical protein